jgi:hypothetical protein
VGLSPVGRHQLATLGCYVGLQFQGGKAPQRGCQQQPTPAKYTNRDWVSSHHGFTVAEYYYALFRYFYSAAIDTEALGLPHCDDCAFLERTVFPLIQFEFSSSLLTCHLIGKRKYHLCVPFLKPVDVRASSSKLRARNSLGMAIVASSIQCIRRTASDPLQNNNRVE